MTQSTLPSPRTPPPRGHARAEATSPGSPDQQGQHPGGRVSAREYLLDAGGQRSWGWAWGVALVLAGYLLFCHGCHGDEDHELFNVVRTSWQLTIP